jgi:hypothetical protein
MNDTPRTDEEFAKTLTPEEEYEGAEREAWAEAEAWAFARKLELELRGIQRAKTNLPFSELF